MFLADLFLFFKILKMSSTYNHKTIEEIIQNKWNEEKRYVSKIDKREKY